MPRVDPRTIATAETRSKGGHARAAKIRAEKEAARKLLEDGIYERANKILDRYDALLSCGDPAVIARVCRDLSERILGRMPQKLEHSGPEGDPIQVELADAADKLAARLADVASRRGARGSSQRAKRS
jgi:hypothetical protein